MLPWKPAHPPLVGFHGPRPPPPPPLQRAQVMEILRELEKLVLQPSITTRVGGVQHLDHQCWLSVLQHLADSAAAHPIGMLFVVNSAACRGSFTPSSSKKDFILCFVFNKTCGSFPSLVRTVNVLLSRKRRRLCVRPSV